MKKIGILTFHYVDNYGAVLQCFALRKVLNNVPGCIAEVIGYIPAGYRYSKKWTNTYQKIQFDNKRKLFEEFLLKNCGIDIKQTCTQVTGEGYDIVCVGSDQVWNTTWKKVEYFLPNAVENVKKISYAASIGCSPWDKMFDEQLFVKYISRFDAISVREELHVDTISALCKKRCECVLDPTLLLNAEEYDTLISTQKKNTKPFLFFYWLKHDGEMMRGVELANNIARKYGLHIIHSVIDAHEEMFFQNAGCMYYEGVEDFLWYIKNAAFVVTNSYHGTIFSVQFETPFYTYIVESMRSRIDTLNEKLGIGSRIVESYISPEIINAEFDFSQVKEKVIAQRDISMKYLRDALEV